MKTEPIIKLETVKKIKVKIKKPVPLEIDELREQFENETEIPSEIDWDGEDYMYYDDDSDLNIMLGEIRARWYAWKQCARANNIIKEQQ